MFFLRVIGRALRIWLLLTWMFWAWVYSKTGLRRVVWAILHRGRPYEPLHNERIVRLAFEALGPTFIKLGQVVASSPGLFPKRYSDEFQRCLDSVKPFPLDELKATVERELGGPIGSVFASFDDAPLGSASIAQVHAATMPDGSAVVVKVQRPGIGPKVDADLWWMRRGAWVTEKLFTGARLANMSGVIEDFDRTIHEELDFRMEAENLREFGRLMAKYGIDDVRAPAPVDALVTQKVLVMERFVGFKADDVEAIRASGLDAEHHLRRGLKAWLMTMMLAGFFHGDAHAGNLMMMPEGPAVGLLDFGIIGRFTTEQRHQVMRYVLAFSAKDYAALAEVMTEIGAVSDKLDRDALVADLERVYSPLIDKNLADIKYEEILPDITQVAYRYGIKLPSEFLLILKQLLFFDRYAKLAAPNLNVFSDFYLVDFLFSPHAMGAGLDFNVLMPLLKKIQERHQQELAASG
ncbi:MAG: AarF/ABC1/UbiB kinase family protein [Myxococcales bacterium]|nr:AarF/ABC1/UbiB kinase family protein [Myxococcales bacterium]MCB9733461.1 AarF/ABC1/UbiB kinase family protein [Deltaproteobacteria bacterium]